MAIAEAESDDELIRFILMRGMGFSTEELQKEFNTVGPVLFSRRNVIRERFKSSEYDDAIEFFNEELLQEEEE